jgi:aminoglycoside phosphotransferase (APT) family kinase protein
MSELSQEDLRTGLRELLSARFAAGDSAEIDHLQRLSGGANMETWRFDYRDPQRRLELILRRRPEGVGVADSSGNNIALGISLDTEAELLNLARRAGVPVPSVLGKLTDGQVPAEGFIMTRILGEALPQRLLRDERYAGARRRLAFQCGEALGRIHSIAPQDCPPGLRDLDWSADLERLQQLCDHFGNPSPSHQLALNWLRSQPPPTSPRVLCHGDFRMGNLLVDEQGLTAVLDWELAHMGFAGEDLGYLCANVWRFGGEAPVGGFGHYRELLDGYASVRDTAPDLRELLLWQLYAALGWGLVCLTMLELHRSGADPGLERAAVGRRLSESEMDILLLLEELEA